MRKAIAMPLKIGYQKTLRYFRGKISLSDKSLCVLNTEQTKMVRVLKTILNFND